MSNSDAGAHAYNPGVLVNGKEITPVAPRTSAQQAYLDAIAEQAEAAIEVIEGQIAGLQERLTEAKTEAKRARAEANSEGN